MLKFHKCCATLSLKLGNGLKTGISGKMHKAQSIAQFGSSSGIRNLGTQFSKPFGNSSTF